jgi:hypothetical protein
MTTIEANEILAAKYPDKQIRTWDWVERRHGKVDHNFSVDINGRYYTGESLEAAIAKVKLIGPLEEAAEKRARAANLEAEAAALEALAAKPVEKSEVAQ